MNTAFNGLIHSLNMAEERISELEDMTIETSKTEKQREESLKEERKSRMSKEYLTATKDVAYA